MRKARHNLHNFRRKLAIYLMDSTNRIFSANIDGTKSSTQNNSQLSENRKKKTVWRSWCRNIQNYTRFISWRIREQLHVTIYYVSFHFFHAQHVSGLNTSTIRSLRLLYCITTLVVCSCFDVWWSFGVAGWGGIRVAGFNLQHGYHPKPATPKLQHTSKQEHTTNVVIQYKSRRLLMMDVLMSETCWG